MVHRPYQKGLKSQGRNTRVSSPGGEHGVTAGVVGNPGGGGSWKWAASQAHGGEQGEARWQDGTVKAGGALGLSSDSGTHGGVIFRSLLNLSEPQSPLLGAQGTIPLGRADQ